MNTETMIKDMTGKVAEVMEAQEAVFSFLDEIEDTVAQGAEAVQQVELIIAERKEELKQFTDLERMRTAQAHIKSLEDDIELLQIVANNKKDTLKGQLEDKAEAFFKEHKSAVFFFRTIDAYMVNNTTLATLSEDKETMTGFSRALANAFASVRQVLLDEGIVANEDQNRLYRGIHLGQVAPETELSTFEYTVRPYLLKLKQAGIVK
jgi:hypothetical protein